MSTGLKVVGLRQDLVSNAEDDMWRGKELANLFSRAIAHDNNNKTFNSLSSILMYR